MWLNFKLLSKENLGSYFHICKHTPTGRDRVKASSVQIVLLNKYYKVKQYLK